jgi:hypothetical protein
MHYFNVLNFKIKELNKKQNILFLLTRLISAKAFQLPHKAPPNTLSITLPGTEKACKLKKIDQIKSKD